VTHDHETDTEDLIERLEDSKGWPNLGKAAAARIRELEAEKKELALDVLAAQGQAADLEAEKARLREVLGEALDTMNFLLTEVKAQGSIPSEDEELARGRILRATLEEQGDE
jgi:hypothetical protein